MRKNKRFILLVVAVLLANCLFAGLASAVTTKTGTNVTWFDAKDAEFFYDRSELNPYDVLYAASPIYLEINQYDGARYWSDGYAGHVVVGFNSYETPNTFRITSSDASVVSVGSATVGTWTETDEDGNYTRDVTATTLYAKKVGTAIITITELDGKYTGASTSFKVTISGDAADQVELVKKPTAANYKAGDKITVGLASSKMTPVSLRVLPESFTYDIVAFIYGKDIWGGTITHGDGIWGSYMKPIKDENGNVVAYEYAGDGIINWEYMFTGLRQYRFSDIVWSVSDTSVAKFTANADGQSGTIEFLKSGSVTIKAALKADSRIYDSVTLTIAKNSDIDETGKLVNADGKTSMTVKLTKGVAPATFTLKAQDAKTEIVKFKSSNKAVATIDEKTGVVTIVKDKEGTVQFTGYDKNGNAYTFNLKVKKVPVSKLTVAKKSLTLKVGENAKIEVTTKPAYAYNPAVKYTSGDKKIATVDVDGYVWAKKAGTTTVTVTPKFAKDTVNPVVVKVKVK